MAKKPLRKYEGSAAAGDWLDRVMASVVDDVATREAFVKAAEDLGDVKGYIDELYETLQVRIPQDKFSELIERARAAKHLGASDDDAVKLILDKMGITNRNNAKNLEVFIRDRFGFDDNGDFVTKGQALDLAKVREEFIYADKHLSTKKGAKKSANFFKDSLVGRQAAKAKPSATLYDTVRKLKDTKGEVLTEQGLRDYKVAGRGLRKAPDAAKVPDIVEAIRGRGGFTLSPERKALDELTGISDSPLGSTLSPRTQNPVVEVLRSKIDEDYVIPKRNVGEIRNLVRAGKASPSIVDKESLEAALLQRRLIEESPTRRQYARILSGRPESISLNDRIIGSGVNNAFVPLSDVSISAKPKPKLAAPTTLLSKLKGLAKARPVLTGLVGGAALDVGLEAALLSSKVLNRWAEAPIREAQRRAEPSTREMIENIYLQRRFQRNRAIEMQANPHLAAYEKHQADLAAGQVPGMVTF